MNGKPKPVRRSISLTLDDRWRVRFAAEAVLPVPRQALWEQLRNFERIVCRDYFHKRVHLQDRSLGPGARYLLEHRALGIGFMRRGRILSWEEGRSYAFSDLSLRGPTVGFPHVFRYSLVGEGPRATALRTEFSGRWTATLWPRETVRLWLYLAGLKIERSVRAALLTPASHRRGDRRVSRPAP